MSEPSWKEIADRKKKENNLRLKQTDLRLWTRCVELGSVVLIETDRLDVAARVEESAMEIAAIALGLLS